MDHRGSSPIDARADAVPARPLFARLRIAQLAAAAASAVPGVERLEAGRLGRHMTSGAGQRVDGLVVGALSDARYEVDLHLACRLVPLPALAERVRAGVREAIAAAGLGEAVGPVHVRIQEVVEPGAHGGGS